MRADEVIPGEDRIRHPETGDIVEVTDVTIGLAWVTIRFKAKGQRGRFGCAPHKELEEM